MVIPYIFARKEEKNTIIVTKRREENDTKIQSKKKGY